MSAAAAARERALSLSRALAHNIKLIDLLPVNKVKIVFSPFYSNVKSIRDFLFILSMPKVRATNLKTTVRTEIRSDKTFPSMEVDFANGHKALFKTENLNTVEVTKEFNKLCQVFMPEVKVEAVDLTLDKKKRKKK